MVLNYAGLFLVAALCFIVLQLAVTSAEKTLCFCNSHACVQSVCKTEYQCYARVIINTSLDNSNSTRVRYGCEEELRLNTRSCPAKSRSTRTQVICCDGPDLCNMPNFLRAVILAGKKTNIPTSFVSTHTSSNSVTIATLKLVSVVVPSLLIIFVILLSLGIIYKLTKLHAKQLEATRRIRTYFNRSYLSSARVTLLNKNKTISKNTNNMMGKNLQSSGELV